MNCETVNMTIAESK